MLRVVAVCVLVLSVPALASAQVSTLYYLPKSILLVSGTVTTRQAFGPDGTLAVSEPGAASVALGVGTDAAAYYYLSADAKRLSKATVALELSGAGIPTSVNATSEGQAGVILKNIAGLIGGLAARAGGLSFSASSPADAAYERQYPEEGKLRASIKASLSTLTATSVDLQTTMAAEVDAAKRKVLTERLADIRNGIAQLRADGEVSDTHFNAWRTRIEDKQEQVYQWVVDVDGLPLDSEVTGRTLAQIKQTAGGRAITPIIDTLRIVLTRTPVVVAAAAGAAVPKAGETSSSLYYRPASPMILSVYRLTADDRLQLVKQSVESVLSSSTPVATLPAPDTRWSTRTIAATFTAGALTKVTNTAASELAGATDALRGLSGDYLAGVRQSNEIAAEQQKAANQSMDAEIARLQKEKALVEARVAQQQALSLGPAKAEIESLETQIKTLTTQRTLADTQTGAAERDIIRLQNALTTLQIEQATLRQKLDALEKGGPGN